MFKFSCADFTFPVLERLKALHLIKLLGFDHVDIGLFARSTHFSPFDLLASPRSYTAQILQNLDAAELRVSDVFLQTGVDPSEAAANDSNPATRLHNQDIFKSTLEFCIALGSKHLTGLPGVYHADASQSQDLDIAAEVCAWRLAECASAGVIYAIEPHIGSICPDVESTRRFLAAVKGLTLTLDYGHFIMAGETSDQVHNLLPSASHVHVRGGARERLQTSVAENTINFPEIIAGLQQLKYDGFLALEYVWVDWNDCNRTDNISETILLRNALKTNHF
jgi:sugar phosphate isomerase/epimerase